MQQGERVGPGPGWGGQAFRPSLRVPTSPPSRASLLTGAVPRKPSSPVSVTGNSPCQMLA